MDRIILCRIAWMKYYEGRAKYDIPRSKAKYIQKHKTGNEIFNFKKRNGKFYGYFPNIGNLNLKNIDAQFSGETLKNVIIVFCAVHPTERMMRVVGWYNNATVFSNPNAYTFNDWVHAEAKSAYLIPENDRVFKLPDVFGRGSLFYFSLHPERKKLLSELKTYIRNKGTIKIRDEKEIVIGGSRQLDLDKRLKVEQAAINRAKKYYGARYGLNNVRSVELEKKGWDLEVQTNNSKLCIEVKGLSGDILNAELTPNEFNVFNKCLPNYHLYVLNNALSRKPTERIFRYQNKHGIWIDDNKSILRPQIRRSAILVLVEN